MGSISCGAKHDQCIKLKFHFSTPSIVTLMCEVKCIPINAQVPTANNHYRKMIFKMI